MRGFSRRRRRGVVLLIVVACIVVAGLAMVSVSRKSLRLATDSVDAETELQQRWGAVSLQRTLLHSAPKMFVDSDQQALLAEKPGPFPSTVRSSVLLGGIKFDVLLSDEQAKLNLSAVYHRRGRNAAEQMAIRMRGPGGLQVRLMPEVASAAKGRLLAEGRYDREDDQEGSQEDDQEDAEIPEPLPAFRHWGQVFDLANSPTGIPASQLLPTATSQITCWGRGEVNIKRATDEVINAACRGAIRPGVARKLVAQYRENPSVGVSQIAMQLEVDQRGVDALRRQLTTESSTYSLWLSSTSTNGTQRWFAVAVPSEEIGIRTERFRF